LDAGKKAKQTGRVAILVFVPCKPSFGFKSRRFKNGTAIDARKEIFVG